MGRKASKSKRRSNIPQERIGLLRKECGLTQAVMGELLGVNLRTVQKLESGDLGLSSDLAMGAELKTGVSSDWLLGDGPRTPIPDHSGGEFSKESYERRHREIRDARNPTMMAGLAAAELQAILSQAEKGGRGSEALNQAQDFLAKIRDEYGSDESYLLKNGGQPGAALVAFRIARVEASKLAPQKKSGQLELFILNALDNWHAQRSETGKTTLSAFRTGIRKALNNELCEEKLRG